MLITCPACGKQVSDTTENCIYCGTYLKSNSATNAKNLSNASLSEDEQVQEKTRIVCPKCGNEVENSQICSHCGYSLQKPVNMDNVNASLAALRNYDKKFSFFWSSLALLIPAIIFLILALFFHPIFFAGVIFYPITMLITEIVTMLNRVNYILSVCKDRYSMISFIKKQNELPASTPQDNYSISLITVYAIAFTCEYNPSAKKLLRKFVISQAYICPALFFELILILMFSLDNCQSITLSLNLMEAAGANFFILLVIFILLFILLIRSTVIKNKFNQVMPTYVDLWLKTQDKIEDEEPQKETKPVSNVEKTPPKASPDDEFDLSNFDLNDL